MKAAIELFARWRERVPGVPARGERVEHATNSDGTVDLNVPSSLPAGLAVDGGRVAASIARVTSELRLDALIERVVEEVARLLQADAADCYLHDAEADVLRCVAVHGLPQNLLGFELAADEGLPGAVMRQGTPVLSRVYGDAAGAVPHPAYASLTGIVVVPIARSGAVRGVLGVATRGDRVFDEADVKLLEAFASLASLALANAESFEESSRQAQVQRGFYTIASVLAEPLSLAETLNALAQAASEALGAASSAVAMPGSDEGLELVGFHELPRPLVEFLPTALGEADHPIAVTARGRRVLAAPALLEDDRFDEEWRRLAAAEGFRSLLSIPVERPRAGGAGVTGAVVVFFAEERRFTDDDLELAGRLADAARGALERSELFESERGSRALAQHVARTGSVLASELDPGAVLDELVEQACALLGVEGSSVSLLEDDELVVRSARGEGTDGLVGTRRSSKAWLAGDVVQSRSPVAVASIAGDERLVAADSVLAAGYESYLGVPLVGPEQGLRGVLAVYGRRARAWSEEEIEALVALASNASIVLSNAELYQSVALERERSLAILANIADGIVAVDRDGSVLLWNAAAEQMTGIPSGEALGRPLAEVLQRDLAGDASSTNRLVSIRRGTDEVWLSLSEAVMRDAAGEVAGRIFAFRDISAERVVDEMRSAFVSSVSHELRSPLTSIYGFAATLLRDDVEFDAREQRTFLGYIASESERLTQIVDALLNVARLDSGELQVQLSATDVRPIVSDVVARFERAPAPVSRRFVVELPDAPLEASADADKLRLVLANLLDNAVRYSPSGGEVTVAARRKGDAVELCVSDEGIGIPPGEQDRIFAKFHRIAGDAAARGLRGGTGLGLFIAQGLVSAMGGRIGVVSSEGKGSTFSFELPLARVRALAADE